MIAQIVREFLPRHDLLSYLEAIMRIYNLMGRRDNIFKAKLKILVYKLGIDEMQKMVEEGTITEEQMQQRLGEMRKMIGSSDDRSGVSDDCMELRLKLCKALLHSVCEPLRTGLGVGCRELGFLPGLLAVLEVLGTPVPELDLLDQTGSDLMLGLFNVGEFLGLEPCDLYGDHIADGVA